MSEGKSYCVYKHTTPSGKVYIGVTGMKPSRRFNNGKGYSQNEHFTRAINKYGWDSISHDILASGLNKEEAFEMEIRLIAEYDSCNPQKGYNKSAGGECGSSGCVFSESVRKKFSDANMGHAVSEETRKKISESEKGKTVSDETRKRMSCAAKERKASPETRKKLSQAMYKRHAEGEFGFPKNHVPWNAGKTGIYSDELRRKMSEQMRGKTPGNAVSVMCVETGVIYESMSDAARKNGVTRKSIENSIKRGHRCCGCYWTILNADSEKDNSDNERECGDNQRQSDDA